MRGTEASLYVHVRHVHMPHVTEMYSHVYCTIKGVVEGG